MTTENSFLRTFERLLIDKGYQITERLWHEHEDGSRNVQYNVAEGDATPCAIAFDPAIYESASATSGFAAAEMLVESVRMGLASRNWPH